MIQKLWPILSLILPILALPLPSAWAQGDVAARFQALSSNDLHFVKSIPLGLGPFHTYHPQGLKILNHTLYLTSVESGGSGYLTEYALSKDAALPLRQVRFENPEPRQLLAPNFNHAGGLDGNENGLYLPLAVYRPLGPAKILKVDPSTLETSVVGAVNDHVGALILNADSNRLWLWNWSAKDAYSADAALDISDRARNPSHWQYQDCKSVGPLEAICSAKKGLLWPKGEIQLIRFSGEDQASFTVLHRVAVPHLRPDGRRGGRRPLTYNAMDVELTEHGLRFYFVPHDGPESHLIVLESGN